jgi:hypothetical protein
VKGFGSSIRRFVFFEVVWLVGRSCVDSDEGIEKFILNTKDARINKSDVKNNRQLLQPITTRSPFISLLYGVLREEKYRLTLSSRNTFPRSINAVLCRLPRSHTYRSCVKSV